MRRRNWFPCVMLLLCLAWGAGVAARDCAYAGGIEPSVLILHSYHPGFTWTDEEMKGIMSTLRAAEPTAEPAVEYMDWKRYPQSAHQESLYQLYRRKYADRPLRVVIVTDNAALGFALQHRRDLFPQAAIVFCGINGFAEDMIAGHAEVTGVVESLDPTRTIQLALQFHPHARQVVAIFDTTESSEPTVQACREALSPYSERVQARFLRDLTLDDLLGEVAQLPPNSIILLGNFNRDQSGRTYSHEEILARLRKRTSAPIYGLWDFLMGRGIVGGSLLSGRLQGATAAHMALRILNGAPVDALPVMQHSPTRLVFDHRELSRFDIPLAALPPGSAVINRPEDPMERYKGYIALAATAFVLLLAVIAALTANIRMRRRAERALRQGEERYRLLADNASDMISRHNPQGDYLYASPASRELLGLEPETVVGRNAYDFLHPDDLPAVRKAHDAILNESATVTVSYRLRHEAGHYTWVESKSRCIRKTATGAIEEIIAITRDITERLQSEQALRESEELYRHLFAVEPDALLLVDVDTLAILDTNEAAVRLWGYSRDELLGMPAFQLSAEPEATQRVIRGGVGRVPLRYHRRKDGTVFPVAINTATFPWHGRTVQFGAIRDISERIRAEEELRESHERFTAVLDSLNNHIYVCDLDTHEILFMNRAMKDAFGHGLVGKKCWDVLRRLDCPCSRCTEAGLFDSEGRPAGVNAIEELDPITQRWYLRHDRAIKWVDGRYVRLQVATDITDIKGLEQERQKFEEQLRQSQKMEAIGTLAGGIAHDFNNILMVIQGRASLMLLNTEPSHPHYAPLKGIQDHVRSAAELTRQLLGFARKVGYEVKPTDLRELVRKSADLFGRTRKEITIERRLTDDLWAVEVDRIQVEQALLNLYVNAWQAMPAGGMLDIETRNVTLEEAAVRSSGLAPGRYVRISVADSGVGMDAATRERIFEPFFTTKEMGRGTGLGLASVYGIIKGHGGFITVDSEPGMGTTFDIYLPACDRPVVEERETAGEVARGAETILLVDDEEVIRNVGQDMLSTLGYQVMLAQGGAEAVELYQQNRDKIQLVILDMVMPGMGGAQVFDRLREIDPQARVLLSSGYSVHGQAQKILERGCNGFLQKPYVLNELAERVRALLDS